MAVTLSNISLKSNISFPKLYMLYKENKLDAANILTPYSDIEIPDMRYKTTNINNRRYLGNKYKLLPFIKRVVDENTKNVKIVADIFAGTGAVASAFLDKTVITNDTLYSNYICHIAWFGSQMFSEEKIRNYIIFYNTVDISEENYMTENFADTYFSKTDCCRIGFIRQNIEDEFLIGNINEREGYTYNIAFVCYG